VKSTNIQQDFEEEE
jgi:glutaminyl-peptide cyclotransferase